MSAHAPIWGNRISTESVGGVPFRMYAERPRSVGELIGLAQRWGERPHVVQGDRMLSFAVLTRTVAAKARQLQESGVAPGSHVFLFGWNSPDWVANFWACIQIGAVPVLANAWWGESELAYALDLVRPALVLADRRGAGRIPSAWKLGIWESDDHGAQKSENVAGHFVPDENAPAVVVFTSGSEGRAKAVVLSHRALLANLQMMLDITRQLPLQFDGSRSEICLNTGPLFHVGGPQAMLRAFAVGNTLVFLKGRFDPAEAIELIERHRINRWTAVPTMVSRLLEHPDVQQRDLRSLRAIGMGGAPVHAELLNRISNGLPGVQIRVAVGYGLTENTGPATAASGADSARKPGTSGRALPLVEIKAASQPGAPDGEILIRSPTQMSGYFGIDTSPIDRDGWLHTGDLGHIDETGLLWITGRSKDLIIRGGENIAPASVERALTTLPGVAEAAVIGVPHPDLGEEVMAFVVVKGSVTSEELRTQLRDRLASFAIPSRWRLQSEPLPTNQTGKIDKAALLAKARDAEPRLLGSESV